MQYFRDVQTWYVVFDRARDGGNWWHMLTRPPFRHVAMWRELREGQSLTINGLAHVTAAKSFDIGIAEAIQQIIDGGVTAVLAYEVSYGAHYRNMPIEPFTCVTMVKRMLGIRNRWVVSPYGLYRELLAAGAQAIKPWAPHVGAKNEGN